MQGSELGCWADDLLEELIQFPNAAHDDQVDALTMAIHYMRESWHLSHPDDPEWEEGQAPHEVGRKQFGLISIANSDSEFKPYMDGAFDAAYRAVQEQLQ